MSLAFTPLGFLRRRTRRLPGFGMSLGITVSVLTLLVVVPMAGLFVTAGKATLPEFIEAVTDPRTLAAYRLSVGASAIAALVGTPLGLAIAWALARWEFPFRRAMDALIDIPFALPTAVSGIALTTLSTPTGLLGSLLQPLGIDLAFTPTGITLALLFTSLPFVVRTVQPVIEDLPIEIEEAARSLGASRVQTFRRVLFPSLAPALMAGTTLAFARALGEYGAVVFIAGNMPMRTEIAPLRILGHLENYDYVSASVVAIGLLVASVAILLAANTVQRRMAQRGSAQA